MPQSKNRRVLVVDDDVGGRHSYVAIAHSAGWEAHACECEEAIRTAKAADFDALILGHSSEEDLGLLQQIHHTNVELPVILITVARIDKADAGKLGVWAVVSKPPEGAELREVLQEIEDHHNRHSDFEIILRFLERFDRRNSTKHRSPSDSNMDS